MSDKPVRGTKRETTANTEVNALSAFVESIIRDTVNTAELVSIHEADAQGTDSTGGRASATPLVAQTDGYNNVLPATTIHNLAFYRPQAGKAAILMRPQPGDMALAMSTKRDSSGVSVGTTSAVPPGSFRTFNPADSVLLNGILGPEPEIWLSLDPESGDISLSTKAADIDISCRESGNIEITTKAGNITITTGAGDVTVEATGTATVNCPDIILNGNVRVTGDHTVEGKSHGRGGGAAVFSNGIVNESGGFENTGGMANTGGITNTGGRTTSNGVTVETHTHTGVEPGGGSTGSPNGGT